MSAARRPGVAPAGRRAHGMVTAFLTMELPTRRALRMPPAEVIRAQ
ncbi:hypothetical protein [Streptomyces sp. NPDC003015]